MEKNVTDFSSLCNKLVGIDPRIRFVGVADKHGLILTTAERVGIIPLLNDEETQQYAITASTRQYTRLRWQDILGKLNYTCSLYEKILRITIPITNQKNRLEYLLIFTLDPDTNDFDYLIMEKAIPLITVFFSNIFTKSP
ncbi:MAG TPA: hypothetical protein VD815_08785 [Candidatus Saccharimonadales bacterium]|nr:hypothetical protein [Candidatus Saccharimonadales bacterium]